MVVKAWARVSVLIALVVLTGCTTSGRGAPEAPVPRASAGLGDRGPAPVSPSGGATREITASYAFVSPSKNIGCLVSAGSARCDIAKKSWKAPPKPAGCELDWGNGIAVGVDGGASIVCAGDTVLGGSQTLPYGESVRVGSFLCASAREGVRCTNERSGHGFTLSRKSYELF